MRVAASVPAPAPVVVPVAVVAGASDSTADRGSGDDYTTTAASSVEFSIAASATDGESAGFVVVPRPDFVTEDHETIVFSGSSTVAGFVVEAAELEITDADRTIEVVLSNPVMNELEDPAQGQVDGNCQWQCPQSRAALRTRVTAVLQGASSSTYSGGALSSIPIRITDGTAGTTDWFAYSPTLGKRVTFSQGSAIAAFDEIIPVLSRVDNTAEPDETLMIGLGAPEGFTVAPATVKLVDDDVQVDLVWGTVSVDEDDAGPHSVVLSARMRAASSVVGSATTVGGLSVDTPADPPAGRLSSSEFSYTSLTSSPLTIGAREVSSCPDPSNANACSRATLTGLMMVDDTVVEGPEFLRVSGDLPSSSGVTFEDKEGDAGIPGGVAEGCR